MARMYGWPGVALVVAGLGVACSAADNAPPVATPSLTMESAAAVGSPVEMVYQFVIADDAPPLVDDYRVFVHFLDADGELMWTDDHDPPTPTSDWTPGLTVEYTRTHFIPRFPYAGDTRVEIGLYSAATGERLALRGDTPGLRSYRVATFDLRLPSENRLVAFATGWHDLEQDASAARLEWHWSTREATLSFANPGSDVQVYLQLDQPVAAFAEPQEVQVLLGSEVIDEFVLPPGAIELRRTTIPASALGTSDQVDLTISVDQTFVPASVPDLNSGDSRELGVRVFRAFVRPI